MLRYESYQSLVNCMNLSRVVWGMVNLRDNKASLSVLLLLICSFVLLNSSINRARLLSDMDMANVSRLNSFFFLLCCKTMIGRLSSDNLAVAITR